MKHHKLVVNHLLKSYYLLNVTKKNFENSPLTEEVGMTTAFKIISPEDLDFKLNELKSKGYKILADALLKKNA